MDIFSSRLSAFITNTAPSFEEAKIKLVNLKNTLWEKADYIASTTFILNAVYVPCLLMNMNVGIFAFAIGFITHEKVFKVAEDVKRVFAKQKLDWKVAILAIPLAIYAWPPILVVSTLGYSAYLGACCSQIGTEDSFV